MDRSIEQAVKQLAGMLRSLHRDGMLKSRIELQRIARGNAQLGGSFVGVLDSLHAGILDRDMSLEPVVLLAIPDALGEITFVAVYCNANRIKEAGAQNGSFYLTFPMAKGGWWVYEMDPRDIPLVPSTGGPRQWLRERQDVARANSVMQRPERITPFRGAGWRAHQRAAVALGLAPNSPS